MISKTNRCFLTILAVIPFLTAVAWGWGPLATHPGIVSTAFTDPTLYSLAREFLTDDQISAITGFQGDLFGVHHNEYSAFTSRAWTSENWWSDVDEITKLQYLGHNCGDSTVPVDHYPANTVFQNGAAQNSLELQVEGNNGYPHGLGDATWSDNISFSYTGTYDQIMSAHYDAVCANAAWYKNAWNNAFWPWEYVEANRTAGWTGVNQGSKFARVIFTDYFLSRKNTVAVINGPYGVNPGGGVSFSSAGSYDPDSITWNADATYYNNGNGLVGFEWDLNNDGVYETLGANPYRNYNELLALVGPTEGRTIQLRVTDDEGKSNTATSTLAVYTPPVAAGRSQYGWLGKPGDVPENWDWDNLIDNGSSDPDGGSITTWAWDLNNDGTYDKIDGSSTQVYYSDFAALGITANENHKVTLRVTDNEGATTVLTNIAMPILVNPVANAGPAAAAYQNGPSAQLSGSGYDPDGGAITQYRWDINNDGTWDIQTAAATLSYNDLVGEGYQLAPSETGHTVKFGVMDNDADITGWWDGTAEATTTVYLYALPAAAGRAQYGWLGKPGDVPSNWDWDNLVDNGSSDPDGGSITTWAWDLNNDGVYEKTGSSSIRVYYNDFTALGITANENHKVTLRVTDNEGQTATVAEIPMPILVNPVANAGPAAAAYQNGPSAQLSGSGYDPDGGAITQYRWDVNNDGTWDVFSASASLSYDALLAYGLSPSEAGHTLRFGVVDNDAVITDWWSGEAENVTTLYLYSLPTVDALERYAAEPGAAIAFSATGSDADGGSVLQWLWDLDGDGQYDDLAGTGSLTYSQLLAMGLPTGQWLTISLKVVDNEGQAAYDTALLALYPSILGDANGDGVVDVADYTIWADNYGTGNRWNQGDFNMNSSIDSADYTLWADNYGRTGSMPPTPEPAVLSLLAVGTMGFLRRPRKTKSSV